MKKYLLPFLLVILFSPISAQQSRYRVISIPVIQNGVIMRDPWAGGLDCPQFSNIDLNQDGIKDLFIFDRAANKVKTYLGNGGSTDTMFTYAPQYEELFPAQMTNWALIRDYNYDGIPDIFTHTTNGTCVFKGRLDMGVLQFDTIKRLLRSYDPNYPTSDTPNIYTVVTDIPVIMDINGDGDMDIMTYDINGGFIGYYENQTIEHNADSSYAFDSLRFDLVTTCYCQAYQNNANNQITLFYDTSFCVYGIQSDTVARGAGSRHQGNSIYGFKDPVYNSIDLLNGNVGYPDLMFLRTNGGHGLNGLCYEWDSIFPTCGSPMLMETYPAAFGVDVNHSGQDDILMAPNVYAPYSFSYQGFRNVKNVMYYKNLNDTVCWFEYQNDSFLVHHMLDFGSNSQPVFYDFNGDGLQDIVVGSYGYYNLNFPGGYQSTLALYENTGTPTSPKFEMVTLDYDSFSLYGMRATSPAFGDLDGDGKADLLVGDSSGYMHFFKNMGAGGASSYPSMTISDYFNIYVGQYATPFIYDVNGDSLYDLVIGNSNGDLLYCWNYGTKTNPMFSPDSVNIAFGSINVCGNNSIGTCFSQPFIKADSAGNKLLFIGTNNGTIYEYLINQDSLKNGAFQLITQNFLGHYTGANATISIADINGDGKMEYLVGSEMGGIMMYSDSLWDPSTVLDIPQMNLEADGLHIYPNPAKDYFSCELLNAPFVHPVIGLFNTLGQSVTTDYKWVVNKITFNSSSLSAGVYIVHIYDEGELYTAKVLVAK